MLPIALAWYALASLATFGLYVADKRRAASGSWRISERTLHLAALLGGWPGALAAIKLVRHKNRKAGFLVITVAIVLLHAAAWGAWVWWRTGGASRMLD
ncbi:MAG: DUF1294 domain-containing protein [Phycisphaerales bacterium]